jgi:hypothetical protein
VSFASALPEAEETPFSTGPDAVSFTPTGALLTEMISPGDPVSLASFAA